MKNELKEEESLLEVRRWREAVQKKYADLDMEDFIAAMERSGNDFQKKHGLRLRAYSVHKPVYPNDTPDMTETELVP